MVGAALGDAEGCRAFSTAARGVSTIADGFCNPGNCILVLHEMSSDREAIKGIQMFFFIMNHPVNYK
jgi:hypothetical protein